MLYREAQQFADGGEDRFLVLHHAAVRRYIHLAIGEGIECIDGLVGRTARCQLYLYACFFRREIIHLAHFDLAFLYGAHDGLDDLGGGSAKWNLGDDECAVVVGLLYLRSNTHSASTFAIVVATDVDLSTGWEVGIELKLFAAQVG